MQELLTILTGAAPIGEVRAAIPLAIGIFKFSAIKAYVLGVFGNLLPIIPGLLFLNYASEWLMHRSYWANRFLSWLFEYTRRRHAQKFAEEFWQAFALFAFVAVPIPLTGVWSGIVAAFVFDIPLWRAAAAIGLGAAVAGLITLAVVLGIVALPF